MKELNQEQLKQVHTWLEKFELHLTTKHFHRNFSDGVLLAQLLKRLFPKMVEMHNYPPKNSTNLKMENWITLNRKVLQKLGLGQSNDSLHRLARGIPGAIEQILFQIMLQCNSDLQEAFSELTEETIEDEDTDILTVHVAKKVGDNVVEVPQKMILYSMYEKALQTIADKERTIAQLSQKVTHLDNFLKLKSERIDNLCSQLSRRPSKRNFLDSETVLSNQGSSSCLSY